MDILDCIIGLGANLFYNASMEACIIICNNNKPSIKRDKVLFIDAKNEVTRKNAESYLEEAHIQKILNAYTDYRDIDGFAQVVRKEDILKNNAELRIALYVHQKQTADRLNFDRCLQDWQYTIPGIHSKIEDLIKKLE